METRRGPRMRELASIVSACPGISKSAALRAAGLPTHGCGSGRSLNRALATGMIVSVKVHPTLCALFENERARERFYLRTEAMAPGCPAGRVWEIQEQIRAIDAERALTWA
jgi:hypothetical protein